MNQASVEQMNMSKRIEQGIDDLMATVPINKSPTSAEKKQLFKKNNRLRSELTRLTLSKKLLVCASTLLSFIVCSLLGFQTQSSLSAAIVVGAVGAFLGWSVSYFFVKKSIVRLFENAAFDYIKRQNANSLK